jgi:2',3'-cyclic-nucleotide 2'-phosphodiesterase (5'-nucleotidase family)
MKFPSSTHVVPLLAHLFLSCLVSILAATDINATADPNLPFGDINVVVLTDVHSWVGGHKSKEPVRLNADYGDVVSFHERLKAYCEETDKDLWFVMNGDWIDGTGISLDGDPSHLIPLLEKMPWDVINVRGCSRGHVGTRMDLVFNNK